jgi:hypothetical protein
VLSGGFAGGQEGREDAPLRLSGDEGSERGRVIVPLTASRESAASGPGEMGQGSHPTSKGVTSRWGMRFLPPAKATSGPLHVGLPVVGRPRSKMLRR